MIVARHTTFVIHSRVMTATAKPAPESPEKQLRSFIEKFEPKHQALIRAVRRIVKKRLPTANELVYDNYNFFVIGYGPTERPSEAIFSITAAANGVGLAFLRGATLPDRDKLLLGSGKLNRFLRVDTPAMFDRPEVNALISAAIEQSRTRFRTKGRGKLIIKSISLKQRPRRSSKTA